MGCRVQVKKAPGIVLYKQYDEPLLKYTGKFEKDAIIAWLDAKTAPSLPELDQCAPPRSPHFKPHVLARICTHLLVHTCTHVLRQTCTHMVPCTLWLVPNRQACFGGSQTGNHDLKCTTRKGLWCVLIRSGLLRINQVCANGCMGGRGRAGSPRTRRSWPRSSRSRTPSCWPSSRRWAASP